MADPELNQTLDVEAYWRWRLIVAESDHELLHNNETRQEWHRVLRIFTDLVLLGKDPPGETPNLNSSSMRSGICPAVIPQSPTDEEWHLGPPGSDSRRV